MASQKNKKKPRPPVEPLSDPSTPSQVLLIQDSDSESDIDIKQDKNTIYSYQNAYHQDDVISISSDEDLHDYQSSYKSCLLRSPTPASSPSFKDKIYKFSQSPSPTTPIIILDDDNSQESIFETLAQVASLPNAENDSSEAQTDALYELATTKDSNQAVTLFGEDYPPKEIINTSSLELTSQCSSDNRSESPYDGYDYDLDHNLGGEIAIQQSLKRKPLQDIDFVDMMNKSYHDSRSRPLAYQQDIEHQGKKRALLSGSFRRPRIQLPANFTTEEMRIIFSRVGELTRTLKPVDWSTVAKEILHSIGFQRTGDACREAFEYALGQYNKEPLRCRSELTTLHSKISMVNILTMRECGLKQRHVFKDMLLLRQSRNYNCATSFNYSSGSVVDMAFKNSTFKLAIANVATQDVYNRPGNLLLCDLEKGLTKQLSGHEQPSRSTDQQLAVTVNDIKLSYSKDFFISGADDHKTMIWNAETGECLNTLEDFQSRVNRVAILEDSQKGQDVFATCSEEGLIHIYSLDEHGQIEAKNKQLVAPGGKRGISSIGFGYGYFWDCLAAGLEGLDNGFNNDGLQGQVAFYDANSLSRVAVGDLGFRYVSSGITSRSVSCISFSSSGNYLVCGTSGRTNAGDDEQGDGVLRVFDVHHAKEIEAAFSGHEDVNLVEFSPCEQYIISCSNTNEVAVFDRRFLDGQPLHRLCHQKRDDDSNAGITSALWWPTGLGTSQSMLVSGGGDGAVKLWDIRRATEDSEIWSFDAMLGPIARMVSSAFFENLIVGGDTGAVSVFTLDHGIVSQYNERPMALFSQEDD
ncbi:hypothetical protein BGX27_008094 [Mortierella sp. AM989]|nr:hypothetical protein BGX27_008094 [Mortierella sp. AM989]